MTTPFVAFEASSLVRPSVETLASGALIGAAIGSAVPLLAVTAELLNGSTLMSLATAPTASLAVTLLVPAAAAGVGGWIFSALRGQREAYEEVAEKAGSLLDETWDLRESIDALHPADPDWTSAPQPDLDRIPTEEIVRAADNALVHAQTMLLHSVGRATCDSAQRMQINVRSLELTPLTLVQERMVAALGGHLEQLNELASDVMDYAEEDQIPTNEQPRDAGARTAA